MFTRYIRRMRSRLSRLSVFSVLALLVGLVGVVSGVSPAAAATTKVSFEYTGSAALWRVPDGVTSAHFELFGGQGAGTLGGLGGYTNATIAVTPGEFLVVEAGGIGGSSDGDPRHGGGNGDVNRVGFGGDGGTAVYESYKGYGGGAASQVLRNGTRILVAGGGGGEGGQDTAGDVGGVGGAGGYPFGDQGHSVGTVHEGGGGLGGTQTFGGDGGVPGDRSLDTRGYTGTEQGGGTGGDGARDNNDAHGGGGGGGGGWFGGGGGGGGTPGSSGGGGSGHGPFPTLFSSGIQNGDGRVDIYFTPPAITSITTQASPAVPLGGAISDTATLAGGVDAMGQPPAGTNGPTGTVTFSFFNNSTCTAPAAFTSTVPVSTTGGVTTSASGPFTPAVAGTYFVTAVYSGDTNNAGVTGPCGAPNESVAVNKATPTITTQASPGNLLGGPVRDVATVSGGSSPTGTVRFRLFSDNTCTTQVFTSANALSGATATSDWFTPTVVGTYWWTAAYSGDVNNNAVTSACLAANESVTISRFTAPAPTQTVGGDFTGPVTVGAGQSVLITNARVVGPVTVNPGGALSVVNSQISRGITANAPGFLSICGSAVSGPSPAQALVVSNATVPIRIGDAVSGCAGNRFAGDVNLTSNLAVTFGANTVSGNVNANTNGPGNTVLKADNISQTLACTANNPPPINAGQPNTAASKTGQCVGV